MADELKLICIVCGAEFSSEKQQRGRHRRFCSPACKSSRKADQKRDWQTTHPLARYEPVARVECHCAQCGAVFTTTAGRVRMHRFCSERCRRHHQKALYQARKAEAVENGRARS